MILALLLAAAPPSAADTAFAQLKTLVGDWRNAANPGSALRVRFSLTAGGTVLVEEWKRRDPTTRVAVLPCGHYTTGEAPFKFLDGYYLGNFLARTL